MRTFEIPQMLYREFGEDDRLKIAVPGYPNAIIVLHEDYPITFLRVFLGGEIARRDRYLPDLQIIGPATGAPYIQTNFEIMETEPFRTMIERTRQLWEESEDHVRFRRIQK